MLKSTVNSQQKPCFRYLSFLIDWFSFHWLNISCYLPEVLEKWLRCWWLGATMEAPRRSTIQAFWPSFERFGSEERCESAKPSRWEFGEWERCTSCGRPRRGIFFSGLWSERRGIAGRISQPTHTWQEILCSISVDTNSMGSLASQTSSNHHLNLLFQFYRICLSSWLRMDSESSKTISK